MRQTIWVRRIFVSLIIILLTFPSLTFWTGDGGGGNSKLLIKEPKNFVVGARNIKRPPLLESYEMGGYQKNLTAWFNNYFYFSGFFIRLKSSLYYLANFKRFFLPSNVFLISYKNRLVGSRPFSAYKRILDEHIRFYGVGDKEIKAIDLTSKKLKYVQNELNKRGKKFLCIVTYYSLENRDEVNSYYNYFDGYYKDDTNRMMETYADFLKKYGINFLDTHIVLENSMHLNGINTVSFYDPHWNRYGAGLVTIETFKYLKAIYKTDWEIPQIKSVEISTTVFYGEIGPLRTINLFHLLENSFMQKRLSFPFIVYDNLKKQEQEKIVVIGDSFVGRYRNQLIDSKFTDEKNVTVFGNNTDSVIKNDIGKIIDNSDDIILVYVEFNFYSSKFKYMVDIFYDYLKANEK